MSRIILITGGQRSGKSQYAERLALQLSPNPVYLATSRIWDDEFRERVRRHQERRGPEWTNIEEPLYLSQQSIPGRVILIDCLTLWTTNCFFDHQEWSTDQLLDAIKRELTLLQQLSDETIFILVTNEIGMGGTSPNAVQRRFTDLLGWTNQFAASLADEVTLMVSGIPVKIK